MSSWRNVQGAWKLALDSCKRGVGERVTVVGAGEMIGRSKIRHKTTRGYKSVLGVLNGLWLTQWVWSGDDGLSLGELVAA